MSVNKVDLSPMLCRASAVLCDSEEKAIKLIDAITSQYPELSGGWSIYNNRWSDYEDRTAYTFFYNVDLEEPNALVYGDADECVMEGYNLIDFDELFGVSDKGIEESDKTIEFLLG